MKVDILGTEYEVKFVNRKDTDLPESIGGACDYTSKTIEIIEDVEGDFPNDDQEYTLKLTLRHEIIHAFLNESGLQASSGVLNYGWAMNEEMIDWFAIQSPKIFKVFKELNI